MNCCEVSTIALGIINLVNFLRGPNVCSVVYGFVEATKWALS